MQLHHISVFNSRFKYCFSNENETAHKDWITEMDLRDLVKLNGLWISYSPFPARGPAACMAQTREAELQRRVGNTGVRGLLPFHQGGTHSHTCRDACVRPTYLHRASSDPWVSEWASQTQPPTRLCHGTQQAAWACSQRPLACHPLRSMAPFCSYGHWCTNVWPFSHLSPPSPPNSKILTMEIFPKISLPQLTPPPGHKHRSQRTSSKMAERDAAPMHQTDAERNLRLTFLLDWLKST